MQTFRHLDVTDQMTAYIIQSVKALESSEEKLNYLRTLFLPSREPTQSVKIDFELLLCQLEDTPMNQSQFWDKARILIKTVMHPQVSYQDQCSRAQKIANVIDSSGTLPISITQTEDISEKVNYMLKAIPTLQTTNCSSSYKRRRNNRSEINFHF